MLNTTGELATIDRRDVGQISAAMAQHADAANRLRRENRINDAIRQMERALVICERAEADHPALAVEGARARMNLSGMFSQGGRHVEALVAIKEAQRCLQSVLAWAQDCESNDLGVAAIGKEAEALYCAALVAEAIELENPDSSMEGQQELLASGVPEQLYAKAKAIADARLAQSHPVASLAKRLGNKRAVCAKPGAKSAKQGIRDVVAEEPGSFKLPPIHERRGLDVADLPSSPQQQQQQLMQRDHMPSLLSIPGDDGVEMTASEEMNADASWKPSRASSKSPTRRAQKKELRLGKDKKAVGRKDIFTDFIRSADEEKNARLIAKGGGRHQEEITKNLHHTHRLANLMLEQGTDDELKDKRYTKTGHEVFMKGILKDNRSRSDPALISQARRAGTNPETFQVRSMNKLLYVKGSIPEPGPEPVAVTKPQIVQEGLAEHIGAFFQRPEAKQVRML